MHFGRDETNIWDTAGDISDGYNFLWKINVILQFLQLIVCNLETKHGSPLTKVLKVILKNNLSRKRTMKWYIIFDILWYIMNFAILKFPIIFTFVTFVTSHKVSFYQSILEKCTLFVYWTNKLFCFVTQIGNDIDQ